MIIDNNLTQKVYDKINYEVSLEKRTLQEIALRKKPKIELLKAISNSIQLLFNNLYSVTEQLIIINNSLNKRISISETTYLKFLNENMKDEYLRYKKNRYFASKFNLIKECVSKINGVEAQYMSLDLTGVINGYTKLDLYLEDYIYFVKNYYEKEKDYYRKEFISADHKQKTLNINPHGGSKFISTTKKADNLETLGINKTVDTKVQKTKNTQVVVENINSREQLKNEKGYLNCSLLPGIDINNIPNNFEIIEAIKDRDLLPKEVNNPDFKFAKYDYQNDEFIEEFVYFGHRLFLQCVNPNSYGLKDGLLIITGTEREKNYKNGYLFFRFYKGKFYLIEHFTGEKSSPRLSRTFYNWTNNNTTISLSDFYDNFYEKYAGGKTVDE